MMNDHQPVRSRFLRSICTLVLLAILLIPSGGLQAASPTQAASGPPYLILLQGYVSGSLYNPKPDNIAANIGIFESLPFDGMTIEMTSANATMQGAPISYQTYYDELSPVRGKFTKFTQNFVLVKSQKPGDLFDNAAWNTTAQNFANLARAAKDVGLKGIMFDNEEYFAAKWTNFPEDYGAAPSHTYSEYRTKARQRGTQVMQAIVAQYPNITMFGSLHGPYESEPLTPSVTMGIVGSAEFRELSGPFFAGLAQGMGAQATLIDGGETYDYRTPSQFSASYRWRKFDIASSATNSAFIPSSLRQDWSSKVNIAYGVYPLTYPTGYTMNPSIMEYALGNALQRTDQYVWLFNEGVNWFEPGVMSQAWKDAIQNARATVAAWPLPAPAAPLPVVAATGANLLVNPNFENGTTGWGGADPASATVIPNAGRNGSSAFRGRDEGALNQTLPAASVLPNTTYQIRGWGRTTQTNQETGYIGVNVFRANGGLESTNLTFKTSTFIQRAVDFTTPPDVTSIQFYVYQPGGGTYNANNYFYADDVSLEIKNQNLVSNAGFETGFNGWTQDYGNAAVVQNNANSGTAALKVGTGQGGRAQNFAIDPNTTYTLRGWAKESVPADGSIGVRVYDSNGQILFHQWLEFSGPDYVGKELTFTTAANASSARVYVWKGDGTGFFYADDISLIKQ